MAPNLINFQHIGSSELGYISIAEQEKDVPFKIKRAYWTYYTPQDVVRGNHANINKELVLIAVAGTITVTTETQNGDKETYILNKPNMGLYIPNLCWHTMQYSHNAVQLVLASNLYSTDDYIRSYDEFKAYKS